MTGPCSQHHPGEDCRLPSLTLDFYNIYRWVDWSLFHHGPQEHRDYLELEGQLFRGISHRICGWATTIMPLNEHCAKGLSLVYDGKELVCRTKATREKRFLNQPSGFVYFCEICNNVIVPEVTVIVSCYLYEEGADEFVRAQWRESWLKCCLLHFMTLGEDKGRTNYALYTSKWTVENGPRPNLFNS